ncbi:MAG: hypothetical protein AAGF59_08035 [Pseudomonadota bacterium]
MMAVEPMMAAETAIMPEGFVLETDGLHNRCRSDMGFGGTKRHSRRALSTGEQKPGGKYHFQDIFHRNASLVNQC